VLVSNILLSLVRTKFNLFLVLSRYCLPTGEAARSAFFSSAGAEKVGQYLSDLYTAWKVLLMAVGIAFVLSLVYMLLLRCCAKILVWVTFIGFIVMLATIGYFFYDKSGKSVDEGDQLNYQVLAITFWALDFVLMLLICCLYDDIQTALTIIEAAGQFVFNVPTVLLVPIFVIFLAAGYLAYWIYTVVFIYSIGEIVQYGTTPFANVVWDETTQNLWYYHLFGLFWVLAFFIAFLQFVVACTAAQWYFSSSSDESGTGSACKSSYWAVRYHLGSLAFGSLILAIVMFVRFIFEYMKVRSHELICRNKLKREVPPTSSPDVCSLVSPVYSPVLANVSFLSLKMLISRLVIPFYMG